LSIKKNSGIKSGDNASSNASTRRQETDENSARTIKAIRKHFDHDSSAPKYHVIAKAIQRAIEEGQIPPRAFLGNEIDIGKGLAISRPTLRKAIGILTDRGLIVRRRGSGSVVIGAAIRRNVALTSLFADLAATGGEPTTKVLSIETVVPDDELGAIFSLQPQQTLTFIRRLRFRKKMPLAIMENYINIPEGELEISELESSSLYRILSMRGKGAQVATQTIGARSATEQEASLLELDPSASLLAIERHSFSESGEAVEVARHIYNAEQYSVSMNLVRGR